MRAQSAEPLSILRCVRRCPEQRSGTEPHAPSQVFTLDDAQDGPRVDRAYRRADANLAGFVRVAIGPQSSRLSAGAALLDTRF